VQAYCDIELTSSDFLACGEVVSRVPDIRGADVCSKVIIVQNPYSVFNGFGGNIHKMREVYGSATAVLCQSAYTEKHVRHLFPSANIMRFRYSFDKVPFSLGTNKEKLLAYMSRKSPHYAATILSILRLRWPEGWDVVNIDGKTEEETADILKRAMVFLSLSVNEGFGMPPAEAMACGCVVVGFTGYAGDEYMRPGLCWPVPDHDVLTAAKTLEEVMSQDMDKLIDMGKQASRFIRSEYSSSKEIQSVVSVWNRITNSSVAINLNALSRPKRIKAVIMHHNTPENADQLYDALSRAFDDVEIFDNGSDSDKVPVHVTRSRPNVYWTGTWNEVLATCRDYDAVWVVGGDIMLVQPPEAYRKAIESALPFGCWSPAVTGRAKPFMQAARYNGKAFKVRHIEGMALAVSKEFMEKVPRLPEGSPLGFGQDLWMCYISRQNGMDNIIDGTVSVVHPSGTGYDMAEAGRQMEEMFTKQVGANWRMVIEYTDLFEENLASFRVPSAPAYKPQDLLISSSRTKPFTIVTVDNGWCIADFIRITNKLDKAGVRLLVMKKGVLSNMQFFGVDTIPYEPSMETLLREADVALFPKVGEVNRNEYIRLLKAGVPIVVHVSFAHGLIDHQKNGFVYQADEWAVRWLEYLRNPAEANRIRDYWKQHKEAVFQADDVLVSVITPTFHRDPRIIRRCIDCMLLQTMPRWEQLICSNGNEEPNVRALVESIGDGRVKYYHLGKDVPQGDFGNSARKAMLGKVTGQFVMFCDDDNLVLPHYMERMSEVLMGNTGVDFAVCRIMHFGPLNEAALGNPPKVLTGEPVKLYHIDPLQVMVRRNAIQKVGWDTEVGYLSDGVTLERLGKDFKYTLVEEVLGVHM